MLQLLTVVQRQLLRAPSVGLLLIAIALQKTVTATKYCSFEHEGQAKYYVCHPTEYCCRLGCCVSLTGQFYHMWFYWLLLLVIVMMCSGGGWLYRFCRQQDQLTAYPAIGFSAATGTGRAAYRPSSMGSPSPPSQLVQCRFHPHPAVHHPHSHHHHHHHRHHIHRCPAQPPTTSDPPESPTSLPHPHPPPSPPPPAPPAVIASCLHRLWKPQQRPNADTDRPPPPSYSADLRQVATGSLPPYRCPYYQLYEAPPSYESVVQLTASAANPTQCRLLLHPRPSDNDPSSSSSSASSSSHLPPMPSTSVQPQQQLQQQSPLLTMPPPADSHFLTTSHHVRSSSSFTSSASTASLSAASSLLLSGSSSAASLASGNRRPSAAAVAIHQPSSSSVVVVTEL